MPTLTSSQKEAVLHDGDAAIVASPGSGKTLVLVEKVAHLIKGKKVRPEEIVLMTFTEKAAREIERRLDRRLQSTGFFVGTIHGYLSAQLQTENPDFQVMDEPIADLQRLRSVHEGILEKLRADDKQALAFVRHFGLRPGIRLAAELLARGIKDPTYGTLLADLKTRYNEKKGKNIDFGDIEDRGLALLRRPDLLKKIRVRTRWILVDEFQDTSPLQWEVVSLLYHPPENHLTIVGDPRQSIYRFRGAKPSLFREASERIQKEGGRIFHLDENFRSRPAVVDKINEVSSKLFSDNRNIVATREPTFDSGPRTLMMDKMDTMDDQRCLEASVVTEEIERLHRSGYRWESIALLFRTRRAMSCFEEALRTKGIPIETVAGEPLLERPEILSVIYRLKVALNPQDQLAQLALEQSPLKGIELIPEDSQPIPDKFWTKVLDAFPDPQVSRNLDSFKDLVDRLLEIEPVGRRLVGHRLVGLEKLLELIQTLRDEEARIPCPEEAPPEGAPGDGVRLLTVHAAKGLQFPVVILCDLSGRPGGSRFPYLIHPERGIIFKERNKEAIGLKQRLEKNPEYEELEKQEKAEEEEESKRLLYVAMTRAEELLILPLSEGLKKKGAWSDYL